MEYLGHFISAYGVETDPSKVAAVTSWPIPTYVKELGSFLGLVGYYRKFKKNYALMSKPLTNLLKKGAWKWFVEAQQAFLQLIQALTTALVLDIHNISLSFVVEIDAVLMQNDHPIAFLSKALGPKWQALSVYEKELLAIVCALQKWEQYLMGDLF